jgi:hypothetical protein
MALQPDSFFESDATGSPETITLHFVAEITSRDFSTATSDIGDPRFFRRHHRERFNRIGMTSERWEPVSKILDAALDQPLSARNAFVRQGRRGDPEHETDVLLVEFHPPRRWLPRAELDSLVRLR